MLEQVIGNHLCKEALAAALQSQRLGHSVLLCGEKGLGAGYLARCLAADYLYPNGGESARQVMEGISAEVLQVEGEGASGNIKVDSIRAVRKSIYATSLSAEGRVVMIRHAEKLAGNRGEAANALLKVLEEPPQGVLFILTAPSEAAVLATIRSRCTIYTLAPVSRAECLAALQKAVPKAKNAAELAEAFGGNLGQALACLTDKAVAAQFALAQTMLEYTARQDEYALLCLLSKQEKDRAALRSLLAMARTLCAAALHGNSALTAQRAARCLPVLAQADRRLAGNGNAKLVLTQLAIGLASA